MARNSEIIFPVKKVIGLTSEMAERIRDYRFAHRIVSENEAIRQLIATGLNTAGRPGLPSAAKWRGAVLSEIHNLITEVNGDRD
jgi:hypothetical protein